MSFIGTRLEKVLPVALFIGASIISLPLVSMSANAGEIVSSIARGGLLYDKWWKVTGGEEPSDTHPAYTSEGKKAGNTTWRCKECHGWDYRGVDGAYGSGSHFTGIKGVNGMAGADTAEIIDILKDDTHGYADLLEDTNFQDLANFISQGQIDTNQYINAETKLPIGGNIETGEAIYNSTCARCHREDGKRPKDMEHPLGAAIASNPWEVMHKIMNGHPGQKMPAFRVFGEQVAVDVMTYLVTLPKE